MRNEVRIPTPSLQKAQGQGWGNRRPLYLHVCDFSHSSFFANRYSQGYPGRVKCRTLAIPFRQRTTDRRTSEKTEGDLPQ